MHRKGVIYRCGERVRCAHRWSGFRTDMLISRVRKSAVYVYTCDTIYAAVSPTSFVPALHNSIIGLMALSGSQEHTPRWIWLEPRGEWCLRRRTRALANGNRARGRHLVNSRRALYYTRAFFICRLKVLIRRKKIIKESVSQINRKCARIARAWCSRGVYMQLCGGIINIPVSRGCISRVRVNILVSRLYISACSFLARA